MENFPNAWLTSGWTKVNGIWYECGSIPQVTTDTPDMPPELTIHQVADKLNELELNIRKLCGGGVKGGSDARIVRQMR